ncbi:MAG: hypothetical protein AAFR21_04760 [Pseudomonadota bacterium]
MFKATLSIASAALVTVGSAMAGDKAVHINTSKYVGATGTNIDVLYTEIAEAANQVCAKRPVSGMYGYFGRYMKKSCVHDTIDAAVESASMPLLSNYHVEMTAGN